LLYPIDESKAHRPFKQYLQRLERLARTNEQMIVYAPKSIAPQIQAMRGDEYFKVITKFDSIWDIPNNAQQVADDFIGVQPELFKQFKSDEWDKRQPEAVFNDPEKSAIYNAKPYLIMDAVMLNPFESDRWIFMDAGFLSSPNKKDGELFHPFQEEDEEYWKPYLQGFINDDKVDSVISLMKEHRSVLIPEYPPNLIADPPGFDNSCWVDPEYTWRCNHFLAGLIVGDSLAMLDFGARFMQTVDSMNANKIYTGREEIVMHFVAGLYPNSIKSIEWDAGDYEKVKFMRLYGLTLLFSNHEKKNPEFRDPVEELFCIDTDGDPL
jgi:hypothetical protein